MLHHQKAIQYALDIRGRKILACKAIKGACNRFIKDLDKSEKKTYPYYFDPELADHACRFIEKLPHTKGQWAAKKELIVLEPWQCFIIANIFGWIDKKTGKRRFRKADIFVARKNGKSIFAAGIGLYMLTADEEHGAEVYCGATSMKQAYEVFTPARQMCLSTPDLTDYFDIKPWKSVISRTSDNAKFQPVIGTPKDGASPHCGIVDEYHEHKTSETIDTFKTGMGARAISGSPLLLVISTAGYDIEGPCFDEALYAKKVALGSIEDERLFSAVYELDDGDDWTNKKNFIKANPNLDISISSEFLSDGLTDAKKDAKQQTAFITKHLNRWVNAANTWINYEDWRKCGENLNESDFVGWDCIHTIDLASKIDVASYGKTFFKVFDGKLHYYTFLKFFLPSQAVEDDKTGRYKKWVDQGYIIKTEGQEVDFEFIKQHIIKDAKKFGAVEIAFDPWNAAKVAQELADEGLTVLEFAQSTKNFSGAMYECEGAIKSKRMHHPNNPVLDWMVSSIAVKRDHNDNIFPRKESNASKIDGGVCMIMGVARALTYKDTSTDYTDGLMIV